MIANADVAKRVSELVLGGYSRIEQSMKLVEEGSSPEEFATYKRAVGRVTATILLEILEPPVRAEPKPQTSRVGRLITSGNAIYQQ